MVVGSWTADSFRCTGKEVVGRFGAGSIQHEH